MGVFLYPMALLPKGIHHRIHQLLALGNALGLHHHPDLRLCARRTHQDPATAAQLGSCRSHRRLDIRIVLGIFLALPYLGSLVAVPIANAVYDKVGSYAPVFKFSAILSVVVLGMLLILYVLAQKEHKKYIANSENLT